MRHHFVLLCASPVLLNRLPEPGPWMEKLRQFLAFPLYATVIWLLWVLGRMLGEGGWLIGALLLLAVTFTLWLGYNFSLLRPYLCMATVNDLSGGWLPGFEPGERRTIK